MTKKRESRAIRSRILSLLVERFMRLSRFRRILVAGFLSLMVVLAVSPVVDEIYLRFFYSEGTIILPSLVSMSMGVTMYAVGWWLFIGDAENGAAQVHILWYLGIGSFAVVLVLIWLIRLIALGQA